jgi:hypothetical protein
MSIRKFIREPICNYLPEVIEFLVSQRATVQMHSESLRVGINYSIVLNSACYVEGALEAGLKALLWQRRDLYSEVEIPDFNVRKTINRLFNGVFDDLETRISRATGPANYDDLFEIIISERISKYDLIKPLWEGVMVLFHFRNVIAHGREIAASLAQGWWTSGAWEENFSGGYRKTEDYLLKNKLIDKRFVEGSSEALYFTDDVADHFWNIAKEFIKRLSESLTGEEKKAFDSAVWPS